jgi:hypothetical protein
MPWLGWRRIAPEVDRIGIIEQATEIVRAARRLITETRAKRQKSSA